MKGKGEWHKRKRRRNYLRVYEVIRKTKRITARQIERKLRKKTKEKRLAKILERKTKLATQKRKMTLRLEPEDEAPCLRTIYRVLKKLVDDKIVRREPPYYVYAPHDILRDRWLPAFDLIFQKITPGGYDVDWFVKTQGIVITPRNIGFTTAEPERLKQLVDGMWELSPPGAVVGLFKSAGKIEKGAPVVLVPREKTK